jgi:hypothetical protein
VRKYGLAASISAEVNGLWVHLLRATATNALSHRADIAVRVQEWFGQANVSTTDALIGARCGRRTPHDASPSTAALLRTAVRLPFATSKVSSTLYYWWLDLKGEQDRSSEGPSPISTRVTKRHRRPSPHPQQADGCLTNLFGC